MSSTRGRAMVVVAILLIAVALAAGNVYCHAYSVQTPTGSGAGQPFVQTLTVLYTRQPMVFSYFALAPLGAGILIALLLGLRRESAAPASAPAATADTPAVQPGADALRLLALLQQEGRLIDFLEEEIDAYSDARVGAAVRSIHAGCRDALHERIRIERIYAEEDGTSIEIAEGFDPALVRLTGNVHGNPPFRGTLEHGGWRATMVTLPAPSELDPTVLAPAEVEIA